jgi:excisionase family DNA binding protein
MPRLRSPKRPAVPEQPLTIRPAGACQLLDCSHPHLYKLLRDGEIESFRSGRARKILRSSIQDYIARQVARDQASRAQARDQQGPRATVSA